MVATLIKIEKKPSRFGGHFFYVFFKEVNTGKSYYSCIFPRMRNYKRWRKVMTVGLIFKGLKLLKKGNKPNLIDADSRFVVIENEEK